MTRNCQPKRKAERKLLGFLSAFTLMSGLVVTILWMAFLGWVFGRVALGTL
jgi:hypothetical protein